jgi:antitoxin MazE
MIVRAVIKKWGNSASIRIPATIMAAARLCVDSAVDVREENGRIVIEPMRQDDYDLDALLDNITPDNVHGAVDTGPARGKEAL